jgi:hypothetical protein
MVGTSLLSNDGAVLVVMGEELGGRILLDMI